MNKIILILAALFSATTIAMAQDDTDSREKLAIGAKVGVNYSNMYDSDKDDFNADPKAGFAAGGFLSIPLGKYLGIQPEVLFSQRGFKGSTPAYNLDRRLNYLDIPLLIAIKPTEGFTILAGPQYSYLLYKHDEFSNSFMTVIQQQDFENDNISKNTFCLTGGFDFNIDNFVLGFRTGWDMTKNKGDGTSSAPRYKNVWVQGTVGFRLY